MAFRFVMADKVLKDEQWIRSKTYCRVTPLTLNEQLTTGYFSSRFFGSIVPSLYGESYQNSLVIGTIHTTVSVVGAWKEYRVKSFKN